MPPATPDQPEEWKIEALPPSSFRVRKLSKEQFQSLIGQTLIVNGSRAKDGSAYLRMEKITFPDGKTIAVIE